MSLQRHWLQAQWTREGSWTSRIHTGLKTKRKELTEGGLFKDPPSPYFQSSVELVSSLKFVLIFEFCCFWPPAGCHTDSVWTATENRQGAAADPGRSQTLPTPAFDCVSWTHILFFFSAAHILLINTTKARAFHWWLEVYSVHRSTTWKMTDWLLTASEKAFWSPSNWHPTRTQFVHMHPPLLCCVLSATVNRPIQRHMLS